ncbi:MAG: L-histidine N(alpha)-methyltransferase [Planctomycetes bacterium]|nr:L-histidine N(alpha)-methyltransferase [Planctomycetota bacterium]
MTTFTLKELDRATVEHHLIDLHPEPEDLAAAAVDGLSDTPRTLPSKYFYDAAGSALFERICALPSYYLTCTEQAILDGHASEMAAKLGPGRLLIEPGVGDGRKTRKLLAAMHDPAGYVPIDISRDALIGAAERTSRQFPDLPITPVCADYSRPLEIDWPDGPGGRVVFFPGSTLGNLHPDAARALLGRFRQIAGDDGMLLIGVDRVKTPRVLIDAYDDPEGVTAAFNYNLLQRLNREADADFDLDHWAHEAHWNAKQSRMESHLVALRDQKVWVAGKRFAFNAGESIRTECSYKYTDEALLALAEGFAPAGVWRDARGYFSVFCLEAA